MTGQRIGYARVSAYDQILTDNWIIFRLQEHL